ncbi:DUF397 domain-containing protein, partial [Streptomyces clavuligerus]
PDPSTITWTTSSHSGGGGNCVQAAAHPNGNGYILLADSKSPGRPALTVRSTSWNAFLEATAGWHPTVS